MRTTSSRLALMQRFQADDRAVSAVEFALILPILLLLLLASFDVTRAVNVKQKATQLAYAISNFVSQEQDKVSQAKLANIVRASKHILYPFPDTSDELQINIESISKVSSEPLKYEIDWSYPTDNAGRETENGSGETSIRTVVTYTYKLQFAGYLTSRIGFSEVTVSSTEIASPRNNQKILANW
jgi:Flp pilus assembly protein TadG